MMFAVARNDDRTGMVFAPLGPIAVTSPRDPFYPWWVPGIRMSGNTGSALVLGHGAEVLFVPEGPAAAFSSSDALLVKRCMDGEEAACNQLFERYYGQLMPICLRYASDADDAKDILQEGFMRIFARLGSFTGSGHFIGWLKRVMVNTAINHYHTRSKDRSNARYDQKPDYYSGLGEEAVDDHFGDIGVDDILALVQRLTPGYRMVFNLFIMEGWSHEQIGNELGISTGTSKSNLNRARAQLKQWIVDRQKETTHHTGHGI